MSLKLSQNINFRLVGFSTFLVATKLSCRDKAFWSRHWSRHTACRDTGHDIPLVATLVATYFLLRHWSRHNSCCDIGRDTIPIATYFLTAACFSSPTCRDHNFFILTRISACEYSLESSLNVEFIHGEFLTI